MLHSRRNHLAPARISKVQRPPTPGLLWQGFHSGAGLERDGRRSLRGVHRASATFWLEIVGPIFDTSCGHLICGCLNSCQEFGVNILPWFLSLNAESMKPVVVLNTLVSLSTTQRVLSIYIYIYIYIYICGPVRRNIRRHVEMACQTCSRALVFSIGIPAMVLQIYRPRGSNSIDLGSSNNLVLRPPTTSGVSNGGVGSSGRDESFASHTR